MLRVPYLQLIIGLSALLISGCDGRDPAVHVGRPDGPYQMTYTTPSSQVQAGIPTELTARITHRNTGKPVQDLQVLHERVIHNFIVNLDFSIFAHIHHEDFKSLAASDLDEARFSFPYTFPKPGRYRIVSEFTHRNRSWTKHFDLTVGQDPPKPDVHVDLSRDKGFGAYRAQLHTSPTTIAAGFETELVLEVEHNTTPVTDFQLLLGSEAHVALWRVDGNRFGHTHSYTPHMASMNKEMFDRTKEPAARTQAMTQMMLAMMNTPAELVFTGPTIPMRYVFPEPGTYVIFLQCAPSGEPRVFDFMLEVVAYTEGMDTQIRSFMGNHATE